MAKTKTFAVIGLGTFGKKICEVLASKGAQVIAIDNDPETIERIKNTVTVAVVVDSTDEDALLKAPLDDVDVAIVAIGDDMEASILTTAILRRRGIPYILSRSVTPIHQVVLSQVGANEVVNIEVEEGARIAQRLIAPDVLDTIPLSRDYSLAEVRVPRSFTGKSLADLRLREQFELNVVALRRTHVDVDDVGTPVEREELVLPGAAEVLKEMDVLLVVGRQASLDRLVEED